MFDKLGIVTNCLARRLAHNDRFEKLIEAFVENGFMHIEIRDGDYLRDSDFGEILRELEKTMQKVGDRTWRHLCKAVHNDNSDHLPDLGSREMRSINGIRRLLRLSPEIVISYAITHPWMHPPAHRAEDDLNIIRAKKIAYLLSPADARLRLVDLEGKSSLDKNAAVSNLKRYDSLAPECPVTLAVENTTLSSPEILNLAVRANVHLAYDEANTFYSDGTTLGGTDLFWERVTAHRLVSVHLKQKSHGGVQASLGEGFVDLPQLIDNLSNLPYEGDWLFEYRATDQPLQDAVRSRKILLAYQKQKGVNP